MISIDNLRLGYGRGPDVVTLKHQTIQTGEVISLVGPNGGGKTTLLRCVSGLLKPRDGKVLLDGRSLYGSGAWSREERARHLAVVLTDRITPAYLRVRELVALGRIPHGFGRGTTGHSEIVDHALAATGVYHLSDRSAGQLSDGERQRVMIARALAQEPRILLLDEPAAHLDPPHQTTLFILLHELITRGIIEAVVIATHHLHLALHFSHRIFLVAGDLQQSGPPAELLTSGTLTRAFAVTDAVQLDPVRGWFVPRESPAGTDNAHNSSHNS